MLALDLRYRYRRETGMNPTYPHDDYIFPDYYNYQGVLKRAYVDWLEELIIGTGSRWPLTWKFKQSVGGVQDREYFSNRNNFKNYKHTEEYKEWIEEYACEVLSDIK